MLRDLLTAPLVLCASPACGAASASAGQSAFRFVEAASSWGIAEPLAGIMAHAAACGDIDGDGDLDLYIGNFCDRPPERYRPAPGPVPNLLLINEGGRFRDSGQRAVVFKARTSGAVFADLDNDGDLDLVVTNNSKSRGLRVANKLFENVGGRFRDVSEGNAVCIIMGGRSIGVLDFDGDGLLDLLVAEDKWTERHTRLFRNRGTLQFEDVTARAGLPSDLPGLGVITPDLNLDGWPDIFVSQANRLFLSRGDGTYREAGSDAFQYPPINREASPCGVAFGDLDRDGDFDLVIVDHSQPARQHLFLNEGLRDGVPRFREATREAHLAYDFPSWTPQRLHLKHAHVEVADLDNDGWPDIVVAATWTADGATRPFLCRNRGGLRFDVPPAEKGDAYFPAGPAADFDRDGRLDLLFAGGVPGMPSRLFLNRSPRKHWLRVQVVGKTLNRMGIGAKVALYQPGKLGRPEALIGYQEIGTGYGYCTGQEAIAHFGLGDLALCDVLITLPFGKGSIRRPSVPADRLLTVAEP
ncbi:MAG: CRTAC1 family protein [Candidatus Brocadiae bacterium]|nr:CRTAC1 family protein [Candidatus Brocadiia bacterium]